jgi:hypothetical protein
MNSAAKMRMTIAATHRHGCRNGTASIAAGPTAGLAGGCGWLRTSSLIGESDY